MIFWYPDILISVITGENVSGDVDNPVSVIFFRCIIQSYSRDLVISLLKWMLICTVHLDLTHFFFISGTLDVKSDFITRLWVSGISPSTLMILNYREFLSVLYVVFFTRPSILSFLPLIFVIIDWTVPLSAFYILIFTIKLAFGILFITSSTFVSKLDYFTKLLVSSS